MLVGLRIACRLLLGAVFVASGMLKVISPNQAAGFLSSLGFVDLDTSMTIVVAASFGELLIGVVLIVSKKLARFAALLSSLILLGFTAMGVSTGLESQPCGCFGDFLESKVDQYFILRNLALLFISMFIMSELRESNSPDVSKDQFKD